VDKRELLKAVEGLTDVQSEWVCAVLEQFKKPADFQLNAGSDFLNEDAVERLGEYLRIHHSFSRQALSKDRFEFALESALKNAGFSADLHDSRNNRGHDITINGTPVSLKTEAAKNIRQDQIHVSKWMELGRGEWRLDLLLKLFLEHLENYERVLTFRRIVAGPKRYVYELVEIPMKLLEEAAGARLEVCEDSRQNPKPGYGYVEEEAGTRKYSLYFDGGTERKLQIKHLPKALCVCHATWSFDV